MAGATEITQEHERRKNAAAGVLHWMKENITQAPEKHVQELDNSIAIVYCRNALELIAARKGEKVSDTVLTTLDGKRLDDLHIATAAHTLLSYKIMELEHQLIDNDLVQLTVAREGVRTENAPRTEQTASARHMISMITQMQQDSDSSMAAQARRDVVKEPMIKALLKALHSVVASGEQISMNIIAALDNNANQKLAFSLFQKQESVSA